MLVRTRPLFQRLNPGAHINREEGILPSLPCIRPTRLLGFLLCSFLSVGHDWLSRIIWDVYLTNALLFQCSKTGDLKLSRTFPMTHYGYLFFAGPIFCCRAAKDFVFHGVRVPQIRCLWVYLKQIFTTRLPAILEGRDLLRFVVPSSIIFLLSANQVSPFSACIKYTHTHTYIYKYIYVNITTLSLEEGYSSFCHFFVQ